jgi:hypothetical protein
MIGVRPRRLDEPSRLLIQAACLDEERAGAAWQKWCRVVDIDVVDSSAQRLLPGLARRPGVLTEDDPLRGRIRGIYRHSWATNHVRWQAAESPLHILENAGWAPAIIGGAGMARYYGDPGSRPFHAVDVLLTPERVAPTRAILNGHGHRDAVVLHDRLVETSRLAPLDRSWWSVSSPRLGGGPGRELHPADLLLHVLAGRRPASSRLLWVVDAHRIISSYPAGLADRLVEVTRHPRLRRRCVAGLEAVADLTDPSPVAPLLDALGIGPPAGRGVSVAR